MLDLSPEEIDCLKKIAAGGTHILHPCPSGTLDTLIRLGLIEYGPTIFLPLENKGTGYRLSSTGVQLIQKLRQP